MSTTKKQLGCRANGENNKNLSKAFIELSLVLFLSLHNFNVPLGYSWLQGPCGSGCLIAPGVVPKLNFTYAF